MDCRTIPKYVILYNWLFIKVHVAEKLEEEFVMLKGNPYVFTMKNPPKFFEPGFSNACFPSVPALKQAYGAEEVVIQYTCLETTSDSPPKKKPRSLVTIDLADSSDDDTQVGFQGDIKKEVIDYSSGDDNQGDIKKELIEYSSGDDNHLSDIKKEVVDYSSNDDDDGNDDSDSGATSSTDLK